MHRAVVCDLTPSPLASALALLLAAGSCTPWRAEDEPRPNAVPTALANEPEPVRSHGFEVVQHRPGTEITDPDLRARIEASGHPWKVRDRATGIEMVLVLPGEFLMGSPKSEVGRGDDEGPQHRVRLTRPYYLGRTEVTQAEWQRLIGPTPTFFPGPDRPIDPSLRDVESFLARANAGAPGGLPPLRLPTEAEWEFACRAGSEGPWHFGGAITHDQVNFNDGEVDSALVVDGRLEVTWRSPPSAECRMATAPAGTLAPNAYGLHDMHGSLWEWCADRYDARAYDGRSAVTVDPFLPPSQEDLRVLRGGSWYDRLHLCRSAVRDAGAPHVRSTRIGLRLARSL
jgi:formylglycine-generating enzyme required for sulfatase activity